MNHRRTALRRQLPKLLPIAALACALVVVGAPMVSASPTAQKILVLDTLCGPDTANNFNSALDSKPEVASRDNIALGTTAAVGTPSAAELAPYDGVVALNDCVWPEPDALGDSLADYQDAGGVVIAPNWNAWDPVIEAGYSIRGRWASGGYSPYVQSQHYPEAAGASMTYDGSNPIFAGVGALSNVYTYATTPANGATELATWNNGSSAVAVKGQALGLNGWLGDNASTAGDYAQLTVNAIKALGPQMISAATAGNGLGKVTSSRGGISCGSICSASAPAGALVKFTAAPEAGSSFAGWSGGCSGAASCERSAPYPAIPATSQVWTAPVAKFSLNRVKPGRFKMGSLPVTVPGEGKLVVTSKSTRTVTNVSGAAGTVKLKLKLTNKAKRKLARAGSLKVSLRVDFTPTGATDGSSIRRTVRFKA